MDVKEALVPEVNKGRLSLKYHWAIGREGEIAVPSKIKPQDIKCVWRVEIKDIRA